MIHSTHLAKSASPSPLKYRDRPANVDTSYARASSGLLRSPNVRHAGGITPVAGSVRAAG